MMSEHGEGDGYGCERCWPREPAAAWKARQSLAKSAELVDESHYRVIILSCPHCRQAFLSVFTETMDWSGGEDSMYWTVVPVSTGEVAALRDLTGALRDADLEAIARDRRSLLRDFPKDASEPTVCWGAGLRIGPHD